MFLSSFMVYVTGLYSIGTLFIVKTKQMAAVYYLFAFTVVMCIFLGIFNLSYLGNDGVRLFNSLMLMSIFCVYIFLRFYIRPILNYVDYGYSAFFLMGLWLIGHTNLIIEDLHLISMEFNRIGGWILYVFLLSVFIRCCFFVYQNIQLSNINSFGLVSSNYFLLLAFVGFCSYYMAYFIGIYSVCLCMV